MNDLMFRVFDWLRSLSHEFGRDSENEGFVVAVANCYGALDNAFNDIDQLTHDLAVFATDTGLADTAVNGRVSPDLEATILEILVTYRSQFERQIAFELMLERDAATFAGLTGLEPSRR